MTSLDALNAVAEASERSDGAAPLDEATRLALRHDRTDASWLENEAAAVLVGDQLSLVVHPDVRRAGRGGALLERVLAETSTRPLMAWSHADHPGAVRLAARYDFERVRELWVMRRPTSRALPELKAPADVRIRGFAVDDTAELLRLNAAAFAEHPEQGAMDHADFAARTAEPWFDPAGLLVAEAVDGRLLGFHWTKQHSAKEGEVYVVGIDPATQGRGLGKLLTLAGLRYLAERGVAEVHLYVESDNAPAIAVYRDGLGFTHAAEDTHVMYQSR